MQVSFHGDRLESLYQVVPADILPKELGGTYGNYKDMTGQFGISSVTDLLLSRYPDL